MRKKKWLALLLTAACGCSSMNNTEKDGLVGAGAGAGAMALLTRGNPVATAVGGLFGGVVGASIGNGQDRMENRDKAITQAQANAAAYAAAHQMSLQDIVQMSQTGISDTLIIRQMDSTGSVFDLRPVDIQYLHDQRVSDQVIAAMQARRYPRTVVAAPPGPPAYVAPPPGTVVIVEPTPPPVGVGVVVGGYRRW
jgi:surface antigen